MKSDD
jgi:hypothetical protein